MAWRGLQVDRNETLAYFLWSAALLPTEKFPFYDLGWTLQHEMAFYLSAAIVVPLLGVYGLIAFLITTALASHFFELPWYVSKLANYHPWFLAGVLAFVARPALARMGALIPLVIGLGITWFLMAVWGDRPYEPIALFFLVIGFANIPDTGSRVMKCATSIGDASYSIYLIHPLAFLVASALVSKLLPPIWSQEPIRDRLFPGDHRRGASKLAIYPAADDQSRQWPCKAIGGREVGRGAAGGKPGIIPH